MKMKLTALLLCLLTILSMTACGGASATADTAAEAAMEEMAVAEAEEYIMEDAEYDEGAYGTYAAEAAASETTAAAAEIHDNTKLIYTGNLTVEATDFHEALQSLSQLVSSYGGYFEISDAQVDSYESYGYYTIRVRSEHFQDFMNAVSDNETCKVTHQSTSVEDVGQVYYDLESHLEMLQGKLDRLNALWEQAEDMEDIITLESAISELEYEISSYSPQKNRYDSLIDYSTIHLTINEVKVYSEPVEPTYGEKLTARFQNGLQRFKSGCGNLLLFFVGNLPQILVFLIIVGGILFIILFSARRKEKKRQAANQTEDTK